MKKKTNKGVSLTELILALIIFVVATLFINVGLRVVIKGAQQQSQLHTQQESQSVLYRMILDIENSPKVHERTPSKLVLSKLDTKTFGYNSPDLFDPVNIGTVTYQYGSNGQQTYLERREEFPGRPGQTKRFLVNQLQQPKVIDPIAYDPTTEYFIFHADNAANEKIWVELRMAAAFKSPNPADHYYSVEVMRRGDQ